MSYYNDQYKNEFIKAIDNTHREKYSVPDEIKVLGRQKPAYTNETNEALYKLFTKEFSEEDGTINIKKVRNQCLKCHTVIADILKTYFKFHPILTIGYVNHAGQDFFKFKSMGKNLITRVNENGQSEVNIHVWITLPSFEIIDLTILAGIAYADSSEHLRKEMERATNFIFNFGDADLIFKKEQCIYYPLYIGKDVLTKNGFASYMV